MGFIHRPNNILVKVSHTWKCCQWVLKLFVGTAGNLIEQRDRMNKETELSFRVCFNVGMRKNQWRYGDCNSAREVVFFFLRSMGKWGVPQLRRVSCIRISTFIFSFTRAYKGFILSYLCLGFVRFFLFCVLWNAFTERQQNYVLTISLTTEFFSLYLWTENVLKQIHWAKQTLKSKLDFYFIRLTMLRPYARYRSGAKMDRAVN